MTKSSKHEGRDDYHGGLRSDMARFIPLSARPAVLEIGCGRGLFRNNFSDVKEYWGVEPAAHPARDAERKLDKVFNGNYEEVEDQLPDDYFDIVVCNDVIEHMADHELFLKSARNKLKASGHILGSVPNVRYITNLKGLIISKDWAYQSDGILDKTHLRFFTQKSIHRALDSTGFAVEVLEGMNPFNNQSILKRFACLAAAGLLGTDVRFLQFAFRATKKELLNERV